MWIGSSFAAGANEASGAGASEQQNRLANPARQSSKTRAPGSVVCAVAGQQCGAQAMAASARLGATVSTAASTQAATNLHRLIWNTYLSACRSSTWKP